MVVCFVLSFAIFCLHFLSTILNCNFCLFRFIKGSSWKLDTLLFLSVFFFSSFSSFRQKMQFWLNRAVGFRETWQADRGSCQTAMMRNLWPLAKWWRYSTQLKMQTLNAHSSWTVWPLAMILILTYAAAYAEQLSYYDFWPLTFRSSAI